MVEETEKVAVIVGDKERVFLESDSVIGRVTVGGSENVPE